MEWLKHGREGQISNREPPATIGKQRWPMVAFQWTCATTFPCCFQPMFCAVVGQWSPNCSSAPLNILHSCKIKWEWDQLLFSLSNVAQQIFALSRCWQFSPTGRKPCRMVSVTLNALLPHLNKHGLNTGEIGKVGSYWKSIPGPLCSATKQPPALTILYMCCTGGVLGGGWSCSLLQTQVVLIATPGSLVPVFIYSGGKIF